MRRLFHADSFHRELMTNFDQGDIPVESATKFDNIRGDQPGKMRGIPGYKSFASGPSGIAGNVNHFREVVINDTQTLIAWGWDGSNVQHFYYSTDGGTTWTELTEIVFVEVLVRTSDTVFTIQAGTSPFNNTPSTTDNAYNTWWLYYHDVSTPANDDFDYVTDYTGSTAQLTTRYGITGASANDKIVLMRFPLWNFADLQDLADGTISDFDDHRNFVRDQTNFKPSIVQRHEAISIFTGREKDNLNPGIDNHSNLWFGFIRAQSTGVGVNTKDLFDDAQLAFSGLFAERKFLDRPNSANLISSMSAPAETVDPLDVADYLVLFSLIYDEFQESPIYWDTDNLIPGALQQNVTTNQRLRTNLSWDRLTTQNEMEFHPGSRRMTNLRIYIAKGEQVDSGTDEWRATTPFFFVKNVDLLGATAGWSGSGPYTLTVDIYGRDWEAGTKKEAELVHGYFSRIRVNSDFGINVNGREIAASMFLGEEGDDEQAKSFLIISAINSAKRGTPDALPETQVKDMQEHSIYEILNLKPLGNLLTVFGKNDIVVLDDTEEVDTFKDKGVEGYWSAESKGDTIYWGNQESLYQLLRGSDPNEIGFSIRDKWQDLSATNRQTSIATYNERDNLFLIHSQSSETFIYDEKLRSWRKYLSSTNWKWLTKGVDGEILGTDGTDIFELVPDSGSTENLTATYEKVIDFENLVSVKFFELMYKITGTITAKIFDLEVSENYPITKPVKFFARTDFKAISQKVSFRAKKIKLQLTISPTAAANFDWEIDWYSFFGEPVTQNL